MTSKQLIKEFIEHEDTIDECLQPIFQTTDGTDIFINDLREALVEVIESALNNSFNDGYNLANAEALFDVSISQTQKDW